MLVGVMSDSHDRLPMIDRALAFFGARGVEAVIHAGDLVAPFAARRIRAWSSPLHMVYGNNDGEREGLKEVLPQIQEGPLFVTLGGRTGLVQHFIDWCAAADIDRADVVVTGHTHRVVNEANRGTLYLNPGEVCGWVNERCTVALLDTAGPLAEICELPAA